MRYVPYLPVDKENDHCQSSVVDYKNVSRLEKRKRQKTSIKKSLNIRNVGEMRSTFFKVPHLLCAFTYDV